MSKSTIIKDPIIIKVSCPCGENADFDFGQWKLNIVGLIEFKCPKCQQIFRTKGLWEKTNVKIN